MAITASVLEDIDEPGGIVRVACSVTTLVTHLRPDLDALLAVWMCQRLRHHAGISPAKVLFVPANVRGVEEGVLAVDMGTSKGVRSFGKGHCLKWSAHPEGGSSCMAVWRALPEDELHIFENMVRAVSDADQRGENIHRIISKKGMGAAMLNESARNQVLATNIWTMHQAMMSVHSDEQLWSIWSTVFDGILVSGLLVRQAEQYASRSNMLCQGLLAVLPHNAPLPTSRFVFDRGAKLAVFSSEIGSDRWTLGVTRSASQSAMFINLAKYQDEITALIPGIYIHPSGYLAGWTATAPLFASREEFEKKRADLIRAVVHVIGSSLPSRG